MNNAEQRRPEQDPKQIPGIAPRELVTPETAGRVRPKGERVGFSEEIVEALKLYKEMAELDGRMEHLPTLIELVPADDPDQRQAMERELKELEERRSGVLQALAKLPQYQDEAAFERMLKTPAKKESPAEEAGQIGIALKEKDRLENLASALRDEMRLLSGELEEARKENPARAHDLEENLSEKQVELLYLEERRIKALEALAEVSPDYKAEADLERSLYQRKMREREELESKGAIEDILGRISEIKE